MTYAEYCAAHPTPRGSNFRGLAVALGTRDDFFRVVWNRLDPDARWRLLANVRGDLDALRLADVVREVRRGES